LLELEHRVLKASAVRLERLAQLFATLERPIMGARRPDVARWNRVHQLTKRCEGGAFIAGARRTEKDREGGR
jgi:hypothetical protein